MAVALAGVAAAAFHPAPLAAGADTGRARWDTRLVALVPPPGFPAHAYVHPSGRIYAGTYVNPSGDPRPSRVFEYEADGTILRSWTMTGQDLAGDHGVQVATSDAAGRLVLLDHTPPRALLLDRGSGELIPYATFEDGSVPNYAAWAPDGALYVTDYAKPTVWKVPPGGGDPQPWLTDPRLAGGEFGTTGIELAADRRSLLLAQQVAGDTPGLGGLFSVAIRPDGGPGELQLVWRSGVMDLADGFAIARSGRVYVALVGPSQIAVVDAAGREVERFPPQPLSGDNGSAAPFDSLSSVAFLGTGLITASQSFVTGNRDNQALHDVETGEPGVPELIPADAGGVDAEPPVISQVSISRRRVRLTLSEPATVSLRVDRRGRRGWTLIHRASRGLGAGRATIGLPRLRAPGRYRLTLGARDAGGNRSRIARKRFRS